MEDGYWDTGDVTVGVIYGSRGWRALRYALVRPRLWPNIPRILRKWRKPDPREAARTFLELARETFGDDDFETNL